MHFFQTTDLIKGDKNIKQLLSKLQNSALAVSELPLVHNAKGSEAA